MTWIKADHRFELRIANFYIPVKATLMDKVAYGFLSRNDPPEVLEQSLISLIIKFRPELTGLNLWAMDFRIDTQRWEFSVCHGSLPVTRDGGRFPCRPLDPAYKRDLE